MGGSLEIRILGPLELRVDDRPVVLGGRQRARILAILVLRQGRGIATEQLVDELWAGKPPPSATSAVHAQMSRLRRVLAESGAAADVLRSHTSGYRLALPPDGLDATRFERLVERGHAALAAQDWQEAADTFGLALRLWRGPALSEFATDQWAQIEAIRLEELRYSAQESKAEAELALGRHELLLPSLERLAAGHPLRERSAAHLMLALYRSGRQGEALNAYQRVRLTLAEELGVDPAPGLQELHQAILRHDPRLDHSPGSPPSGGSARGTPARIANLPPRNPVFCGRADLMAALRDSLTGTSPRAVALYGLSGVGKTQLALEYAHRWEGEYTIAWRVSGIEPMALAGNLAELAAQLGVPRHADRQELSAGLAGRLSGEGRWLLILDDLAEAHPLVMPFLLAPGKGHLIITSRSPAWGRLAMPLEVKPFSRAESLTFLARRLPQAAQGAELLAAQLGDLPVALEQAAAYAEQTGMTLREYGELFRRQAGRLLGKGTDTGTGAGTDTGAGAGTGPGRSVSATWQLAFDRVRGSSPAAGDLLSLCAVLGPDGTPLQLLRETKEALPPALKSAVLDEVELEDTVAELFRQSLVSREQGRLRMHPLVRAAARDLLAPEARQAWLVTAIGIIKAATPLDPDNPASRARWDEVIPHLVDLMDQLATAPFLPQGLPHLLCRVGRYLAVRAEFDRARHFLETALRLTREHLGADHLDIVRILTEQGHLKELLGDLHGAQAAQEEALALAERTLGPDDPVVAQVLRSLAGVLTCRRLLPDAEAALARALRILGGRPSADRRLAGLIMLDLGMVAWTAGDLRAARTRLTRALAMARREVGDGHPDVAHALSGLGQVRQDAGELAQALSLQRQATALLASVHGDKHPEVAHGYDKLGYVLRLNGDTTQAGTAHARALEILESCYGPHHGEIGMPLTNLGLVHAETGALDRAAECQERAIQVFARTFGADHPHTQLARRRLATVLLGQGHAERARDLLEQAVAGIEGGLGPAHPDLGHALLDLAAVCEHLRDHEDALACRARARRILRRH